MLLHFWRPLSTRNSDFFRSLLNCALNDCKLAGSQSPKESNLRSDNRRRREKSVGGQIRSLRCDILLTDDFGSRRTLARPARWSAVAGSFGLARAKHSLHAARCPTRNTCHKLGSPTIPQPRDFYLPHAASSLNFPEPSMPKNNVSDPITDQEIAFARLVLSGAMTDRRAARSRWPQPRLRRLHQIQAPCPRLRGSSTAPPCSNSSFSKKPPPPPPAEQRQHRLNLDREQVQARLWEIANLSPEMTRRQHHRPGQGTLDDRGHAKLNPRPSRHLFRRKNLLLRPTSRKSLPPPGAPRRTPQPSTRSQTPLPSKSKKMSLASPSQFAPASWAIRLSLGSNQFAPNRLTPRRHLHLMSRCSLLFQTSEFLSL